MKHRMPRQAARIVLASASPRRRELLRQAGLAFRVLASGFHEGGPHGDPKRFARDTACAKARETAGRLAAGTWVLAADTLVVQGLKIYGKPRSRAEARRMLQALSGREHAVLTGVCLQQAGTKKKYAWVEKTRVSMRALSRREIERYLESNEWQDKAGAYGIQGRAGVFVTRVIGCYYNVVGLPLAALFEKLQQAGVLE